ncbi:MAG: SRPBCC family protein [Cyclobacteriaceae bacterium]|nr:SRPBCC family protein [Cyclobacteriaceae bacterium]
MRTYQLVRTQWLPLSVDEAWDFFSSPSNLQKITPAKMNFHIISMSGGSSMYAGQIIRYKVNVLPLWRTSWVTEITHVDEHHYFVDEQRVGPYTMWHHQHQFIPKDGGVEMTDTVTYAIPLGPLGVLAHWLFVGRQVSAIFEYRKAVLQELFAGKGQPTTHS